MSGPAVEFAYLPIKPEASIEADQSEPYKAWQEILNKVAAQPGYQRLFWGRILEKPDVVHLAVEWAKIEDHSRFINSPEYGPFFESLKTLLADSPAPQLYHINFSQPTISFVTSSGATEVVTFTNPSASFIGNLKKFVEEISQKKPAGMVDAAVGESYEDTIEKEGGKAGKGKAVVLTIGWASKEAHMKFRETEEFAKHVHLIREGSGDVEMFHTVFQSFKPRGSVL